MMFAWYFPKNFWDGGPKSRHNWASMVLWIDNPAFETPKLIGASFSQQVHKNIRGIEYEKEPYNKLAAIPPKSFIDGSNVSTRVAHTFADQVGWIGLKFTDLEGEYQDLIMWNQLTDQPWSLLISVMFRFRSPTRTLKLR
ncbi:hypothetical protein P3T76_013765 [Phytophthora citrophthora]|uniref:Necrosis inducing-like protein NPP1 type n=1 Tax=Phytophthora citrophthora TaxID=4793 RepID=A0AAD9G3F3_9STRA|nr:hypothetical protein P3T76_013765 [Phytophthora citrophthora]